MLKELFDYIRQTNQSIYDGFNDKADVLAHFAEPQDTENNIDIIYAFYDCGYYEGSASVYWFDRKEDKYYETHGGHCSCYGLEGQWSPEEILFVELEKRMGIDFFGSRINLGGFQKGEC